ncbi:MAG TPA: hydrolase [Gemmatimonadaceae bacterium]
MTPLSLDPTHTALVVVDLQRGILSATTAPHTAADVLLHATHLAERFRERGALVVLVRVDPGPKGELFPRPLTDVERPPMTVAPGWSDIAPELGPKSGDVVVTKHQPGAFFATDLDVQLRRRKIDTIVLCGISTNVGVEATARVGFEHGYNLVFASDAVTARDAELHTACVAKFFPTIGRVRTTDEILGAL